MTILPAAIIGRTQPPKSLDRRVVVTDPVDGRVNVRWQLGRTEPWRCSACGAMAEAACMHTFSAGVVLAEALLGLTRVPELNPTEGIQ